MAAVTTALTTYTPTTQAQAYLRSLENKARNKVIEKIEKNAGKSKEADKPAANTQTSKSGSEVQTTQGVYSQGVDPFKIYVDNLTAPETCQFLNTDFNDIKVNTQKDVKFLTCADAIKALPALPTAEQIIKLDVAPVQAMNDFNKGCGYYYARVTDIYTNATQNGKDQIAAKRSKAGSPQMNSTNATQILQLMQKHGNDPQKASDKEMEAFVMKMIASGELQLQGGGGVVDANYSDAQEAAIDKIDNKINELNNKLTALYEKYNDVYNFGKEKKLRDLYNEQQKAWSSSDAYKQVYNTEKDIDNRSLPYIKNNPSCLNYPDFWVAGRKQENEAITKFNLANAVKWRAILQEVANEQQPLLNEFTSIETELEAAFSNKEDMSYALLKHHLGIAFFQWSKFYGIVYSNSYGLPLVRHVSEDSTIGQ